MVPAFGWESSSLQSSVEVKLSGMCWILSDGTKGQGSDWELTIIMTHAIYLQSKAEATAQSTELMPSC